MTEPRIIAVADIGTSKVCVIIGEVSDKGLRVLGFGTGYGEQLRNARTMRPRAIASCLREALESAEMEAGVEVRSLIVGLATGSQRGENVMGEVRVGAGIVQEADVVDVQDRARDSYDDPTRVVLHALVQDYTLDQTAGIRRPVGMAGRRLRVRSHLVLANHQLIRQLQKVSELAQIRIDGIVAQPIASSLSVLTPEECRDGVVLIDIGGSCTDVLVWCDGSLVHSVTYGMGGENITRDIAEQLQTDLSVAARLKEEWGVAHASYVDPGERIEYVTTRGDRLVSRSRMDLMKPIQERIQVVIDMVETELKARSMWHVANSFVLVGGTTEMPGVLDVAEEMLGRPVRLGIPELPAPWSAMVRQPRYAAAVGLLRYVAHAGGEGLMYRLREPSRWERMYQQLRKFSQRLL